MDAAESQRIAAKLVRVIASYDFRDDVDEFTINGIALAVRKYPQFSEADWQAGVIDWYSQPDQRRIKVGDLIQGAKRAYRTRTGAGEVPRLTGGLSHRGMPANFWDMVEEARQVSAEIRATGVIPTADIVERETARRRRARHQQQQP